MTLVIKTNKNSVQLVTKKGSGSFDIRLFGIKYIEKYPEIILHSYPTKIRHKSLQYPSIISKKHYEEDDKAS